MRTGYIKGDYTDASLTCSFSKGPTSRWWPTTNPFHHRLDLSWVNHDWPKILSSSLSNQRRRQRTWSRRWTKLRISNTAKDAPCLLLREYSHLPSSDLTTRQLNARIEKRGLIYLVEKSQGRKVHIRHQKQARRVFRLVADTWCHSSSTWTWHGRFYDLRWVE